MATTGPLADFGRLPTERKALIFIVIGLVIGAIYFRFGFKGLNDDLDDARTDNEGKIGTNKKLGDDIPK
ncbi:MAG TPA: hypothetical protein VGM88_13675, partial [Kofleriaceae bacterium]